MHGAPPESRSGSQGQDRQQEQWGGQVHTAPSESKERLPGEQERQQEQRDGSLTVPLPAAQRHGEAYAAPPETQERFLGSRSTNRSSGVARCMGRRRRVRGDSRGAGAPTGIAGW